MGSKRATDQVHNDSQTIVKYPIRVTVRFRFRVRVRVHPPIEQPQELRIINN